MSKLLKLKQWLAINEAAKYLTGALSEPVTEADVFRLSLDGALTLSVYFISSIRGKYGYSVPFAEAKTTPSHEIKGLGPYRVLTGISIENHSKVVEFGEEIRLFENSTVFDLPMIGGERISCEQRYQSLTNGPYVDLNNIEGTFLQHPNTNHYVKICESIPPAPESGDDRSVWERHNDIVWIPAGKLPDHAIFIVRIDSLTKMLSSLSTGDSPEKPLSNIERNTLLTIIAVLCKEAKLDYKTASKTAGLIQSTAASMKVSIGETTIEGHLKKIPDALGTRTR